MQIDSRIGIYVFLLTLSGFLTACPLDSTFQNQVKDSVAVSNGSVEIECSVSIQKNPVYYNDGIYTGESPGWTGMRVQIRIKNGIMNGVKVLKAKGTPEYYDEVVRRLPRIMEQKGSVDIDGISGATLSSDSLKDAVRSALKEAE